MSTTPHLIAPEEIMAHLDGELSPARAQYVSFHLDSCTPCQALITSLRNNSQSLSDWTVGSVPAALENNVMLAVSKAFSDASFAGSTRSLRTHRWSRNQWIGGLAATVGAIVLLFFIAPPSPLRSRMTRSKTVIVAEQSQMTATDKPMGSMNMDGQPLTDQQSRVFSNQLPLESGASSLNSVVTLTTPGATADSNGLFHGLGDHVTSFGAGGGGGGFGQPATAQKADELEGPMIARTVTLALLVKDFDSARASLDAILARHNGYAATLGLSTPLGAARSLQASLRVPQPQLVSVLAELRTVGHVETEMQNSEEVTRQHADLVARLKNSRETEGRLQAMLMQRTGTIGDVLAVEQEMARVRAEIEQMEAEQKNLEHRVSYTAIDLSFSEEYKAKLDSAAPSISTLVHNAAVNGYRNVTGTLLSIILFFVAYGPVLIFWLLALSIPAWLVWRRWRQATASI
jgi:uncharacterized protein DUF4349/putative zinc finger protein